MCMFIARMIKTPWANLKDKKKADEKNVYQVKNTYIR